MGVLERYNEISRATTGTTALVLAAFAWFASPCYSGTYTAEVVKVLDGDTIKVDHSGQEEDIRLNGIDCPEKNQVYGKKAKEFTSRHVSHKTIIIDVRDVDRDGRPIANVLLPDGRNLNHELVKEGLAWWFFKYSTDETLRLLEIEARDAKRGLWADPIPIPPWVFRKIQHKTVPELSDFQYPGTIPSGVICNKRSKACRHANCKKYDAMRDQKNIITLETAEEAEKTGYHMANDCPRDSEKPSRKPSQPPGEKSPDDLGVSPEPGSDEPPMEEKGMEERVDDKKGSD